MDELEVGDVIAFRKSDSILGHSRRAKLLSIKPSGKSSFKYLLEFDNGRTRKVPRSRIRGMWENAEEIDELINYEINLQSQSGDRDEQWATSGLIEKIITEEITPYSVRETPDRR